MKRHPSHNIVYDDDTPVCRRCGQLNPRDTECPDPSIWPDEALVPDTDVTDACTRCGGELNVAAEEIKPGEWATVTTCAGCGYRTIYLAPSDHDCGDDQDD